MSSIDYKAGACFPLPAPFGCREHELEVILEIEDECVPQYLQVYWDFSLPSYNECFPLPAPFGCLEQGLDVKLDTLDEDVPQYWQ